MDKKLYRLKKNRMLAGVAAGMAEYFSIDVTVMRLIFVAVGLAFFPLGVVAYIVAAIVMPENENTQGSGHSADDDEVPCVESSSDNENGQAPAQDNNRTRLIIGGILLFLGASLLTRHILPWYYARFFWPLLLLTAGGLIIYTGWRR